MLQSAVLELLNEVEELRDEFSATCSGRTGFLPEQGIEALLEVVDSQDVGVGDRIMHLHCLTHASEPPRRRHRPR